MSVSVYFGSTTAVVVSDVVYYLLSEMRVFLTFCFSLLSSEGKCRYADTLTHVPAETAYRYGSSTDTIPIRSWLYQRKPTKAYRYDLLRE